ncbi:MAG: hypothetical protein E7E83_10870 [Enterobacter ludwigii]|nr:hypothetical protein [Enterobacter ludwigii]
MYTSTTEAEAIATLQHATRHHDAEQGISRDMLATALGAIRQ